MDSRRPSARRLSELKSRPSRVDQGKRSFIPRPSSSSHSFDRVSGVRPLEHEQSHMNPAQRSRNRSAEPVRSIRPGSVQRFNVRPQSIVCETPNYHTPLHRNMALFTPMSAMSNFSVDSHRAEFHRSPSSERAKSLMSIFQRALKAEPAADTRPVSDQGWQKNTGSRIVSMLREDENICAILPNSPAPLKPITIRLFLDITNYLFAKFGGKRFQINSTDYVEKLPNVARKLLYPGILTKSWLKSVNAMHTYPNLLAFLSYMVDISAIKDSIEMSMDASKLFGNTNNGHFHQVRHSYFIQAWMLFQDSENFEQLNGNYVAKLKELYGVNDEEMESNQMQYTELKKEKHDLIMMAEKLKEDKDSQTAEFGTYKNKSTHLEAQLVDYKNKIISATEKIAQNKRLHEHIRQKNDDLQKQILHLQQRLSEQKMTVAEYEETIRATDRLNEIVHAKEEILNQMEKFNFEKDLILVAEQRKVLDVTIVVNKKLFTVGLAAGHPLTNFSILERDLLAPGTIDNVKHTISQVKDLTAETESQLHNLQSEKEHDNNKLFDLKRKIEAYKTQLSSANERLSTLEKDISQTERRNIEMKEQKHEVEKERNRLREHSEKTRDALHRLNEEYSYWKHQNMGWENKLSRLQEEEPLVRDACRQRSKALLAEYINIANQALDAIEIK